VEVDCCDDAEVDSPALSALSAESRSLYAVRLAQHGPLNAHSFGLQKHAGQLGLHPSKQACGRDDFDVVCGCPSTFQSSWLLVPAGFRKTLTLPWDQDSFALSLEQRLQQEH